MRTTPALVIVCFLAIFCLRTIASGPDRGSQPVADAKEPRFRETVRPFLERYCLDCHTGQKPKGELDLSVFTCVNSVAKDLESWDLVMEQLRSRTMPPSKAKEHPSDQARQEVIDWVRDVRKLEASRNSGDPGSVLARRLSNAEYDHTIRDLTGVDIRPTREFPVDPANEAGFDNSAESLTMSPSLARKYLEAARRVADHLVLKPNGFGFATHSVVADTDRDKYCVRRIIDFYKGQRLDLADFFLAAWRFQHREAIGRPDASLAELATESGISPKYLATIWTVLAEPAGEVGPIAAIQSLWRDLPAPGNGDEVATRAGTERLRDFVLELRQRLTPEVKNLSAPGIQAGSQTLVLWKDRQMAANRRRYAGGAERIRPDDLKQGTPAARALALPDGPSEIASYEPSRIRFCSIFPDAFFISERARVYLDPSKEKGNAGRLLSAGFHSMTGYFRDDAPLSELVLDETERRKLDDLWEEFDFITGAPMRQYSSFLWFERTDSQFMRGAEFDFARAEDRDAGSELMIKRLCQVYSDKASRRGASEVVLQAIRDHFEIISASIRRVERGRLAAEPGHIKALQDFAERAYRRPLSKDEREGVADFYRTLREQDKLGHEDAVRDTVVAVLMSPHFCYRLDEVSGAGPGIRPLSDFALASRLSYFLWASMPDRELLDHAAAGELHRPDVLNAQARRMLKDDRVRGLATEFAGNWLDFRRFEEHNSVDRGRFPSFDDQLRRSMFEEPIRFFDDVVRSDRSVLEFLDGDHTFVNPVLARHYGMPVHSGGLDDWVRIGDARRYGRGGLLPMAVFLTKNAPGLRTSPVKRGYWVVRRLLGEEISAPPANVPDLPDDESKLGDRTLRETLARHRADASCAGCHERFDAIGLAFEGYGPVGEAREKDLGGRPVDTRATFPGGEEGVGVDGLREYLQRHRKHEFVENLCRKLLAYGLGRGLILSDDGTIEAMKVGLAKDGHRFGGLIEVIVTSPQFLNKRVESPTAERARP